MEDAISALQDRLTKAQARLVRAQKALDSSLSEVTDLETALRVLASINGESPNATTTPAVSNRQVAIIGLLGVGRNKAAPPAELFEKYRSRTGEDITIDTFRTTIWRMKDKIHTDEVGQWAVEASEGAYWKTPVVDPTSLVQIKPSVEIKSRDIGEPDHPDYWGVSDIDDDDSDVPF
jgi:hypothetical protein